MECGQIDDSEVATHLFGLISNVFTYQVVGLPDLEADDYLHLPNPLAPALSALMRTSKLGKVAQKYRSLLALARSGANEAQMVLLTNVVEKYLKLTTRQKATFEELINKPESEEVRMVVSVYEERGIEKGIQIGTVQTKRETLALQLEQKFGKLPDDVQRCIHNISDSKEFDRLFRLVLTAQSIEEMGF